MVGLVGGAVALVTPTEHGDARERFMAGIRDSRLFGGLQRRSLFLPVEVGIQPGHLRADRIIDLGPAAGIHGGELLANGTPAEIRANDKSLTGLFLARGIAHPLRSAYRTIKTGTKPARQRQSSTVSPGT